MSPLGLRCYSVRVDVRGATGNGDRNAAANGGYRHAQRTPAVQYASGRVDHQRRGDRAVESIRNTRSVPVRGGRLYTALEPRWRFSVYSWADGQAGAAADRRRASQQLLLSFRSASVSQHDRPEYYRAH